MFSVTCVRFFELSEAESSQEIEQKKKRGYRRQIENKGELDIVVVMSYGERLE